ncbi:MULTISPECIES: hypothetical protein [Lactobacillaceae]|uniref:Uncharacterized protein n=3 Tax=Lactobacillaceae TaxID=33958 RepID=A0A5P8M613_9LACO|nr:MULTISPECIES: hypothetical protein [Lactobacillaceae]QFR23675.1 hypothetical protein D1010_09800 [Schleiferilactobacillus harbinensis]
MFGMTLVFGVKAVLMLILAIGVIVGSLWWFGETEHLFLVFLVVALPVFWAAMYIWLFFSMMHGSALLGALDFGKWIGYIVLALLAGVVYIWWRDRY